MLYRFLHQENHPDLAALPMERHRWCFVNPQVTDFYIQGLLNPRARIMASVLIAFEKL